MFCRTYLDCTSSQNECVRASVQDPDVVRDSQVHGAVALQGQVSVRTPGALCQEGLGLRVRAPSTLERPSGESARDPGATNEVGHQHPDRISCGLSDVRPPEPAFPPSSALQKVTQTENPRWLKPHLFGSPQKTNAGEGANLHGVMAGEMVGANIHTPTMGSPYHPLVVQDYLFLMTSQSIHHVSILLVNRDGPIDNLVPLVGLIMFDVLLFFVFWGLRKALPGETASSSQ